MKLDVFFLDELLEFTRCPTVARVVAVWCNDRNLR
jgi:hypothetical protein